MDYKLLRVRTYMGADWLMGGRVIGGVIQRVSTHERNEKNQIQNRQMNTSNNGRHTGTKKEWHYKRLGISALTHVVL
jgi:hypothetical protein